MDFNTMFLVKVVDENTPIFDIRLVWQFGSQEKGR